jgi:hypothetical protein
MLPLGTDDRDPSIDEGRHVMAGPNSLSATQVAAAAKQSVAKALAQHKLNVPPGFPLGYVRPPWWWLGIIIRNPGLTNLEQVQSLAKDIHAGIAASVPSAKGGIPGAVLQDGNLTIGFAPPEPINLLEG